MHAEGIETVVVAEASFDFRHHEEAESTREQTNEYRWHWSDEAGRGSDSYQAGNRARDRAQRARFAIAEPLNCAPTHDCCSRGEMRRHECACGQAARGQRASRVEAKPAHP